MKKIVFILMNLVALSGCASNSALPKAVHIPVAVACPKPQIPAKPILPLASLSVHDNPDVVMKAYVASIKLLDGYNQELIHLLKSYGSDEG